MSDISRRNLVRLAAFAPLASAVAGPDNRKRALTSADAVQEQARARVQQLHLPNLPLLTHEGRKVRFYDDVVKDKIVSINFFYSKCDDICPVVMPNLAKVQHLLGNQVGRKFFMYTITLKPEEDTVDVIRSYRKNLRAGPGWTFLTGTPADIEGIRKGIGFTYPDPKIDGDKTQHIGNVRYGNEPLMLWAACPGMAHAEWIAESFSWMIKPDTNRVQPDDGSRRPADAHMHDHMHDHPENQ
ncbi:MAG TPA: SCO family protein [Bryobacteraceae bacterium]|jgi:protein SCO1/2